MSPVPEKPPVPPEDSLLFSLISAEFDGELSPSEIAELRMLELRFPDRGKAFRGRCAQLRENLQELPVIPSRQQADLSSGRPHAASLAAPTSRAEFRQRIPLPTSLRSPLRRAIAVVSMLLASVLCVILLRPGLPDRRSTDEVSTQSNARQAVSAPAELDSVAMQAPAAVAASAFSDATTSPPASANAASPALGELQPLLTAGDWQVVVVRVRRGGPDDVLAELREVLGRHGLTLARSQPVTMPEWLGVFLPASIPHRKSLLEEVQQGLVVDAPEWDPTEIMRSSRDSILQAVRQSLASPTRGELSGGEVFVAVSPAISGGDSALAKSEEAVPLQIRGAAAGAAGTAGTAAARGQTPASEQPGLPALLLVFEFSQESGGSGIRRIF